VATTSGKLFVYALLDHNSRIMASADTIHLLRTKIGGTGGPIMAVNKCKRPTPKRIRSCLKSYCAYHELHIDDLEDELVEELCKYIDTGKYTVRPPSTKDIVVAHTGRIAARLLTEREKLLANFDVESVLIRLDIDRRPVRYEDAVRALSAAMPSWAQRFVSNYLQSSEAKTLWYNTVRK
jgi:hypothetical protein